MIDLEQFVKDRLNLELEEFNRKNIGSSVRNLNKYEKVLVYYYTQDGYLSINEELREGRSSEYEAHLNAILAKLPNLEEVVFRGVSLTETQLEYYSDCFNSRVLIEELAFCSCSKSVLMARMHGNAILKILSKRGKSIEELSFYGINSSQNEQEVLFQSKTKFKVLDIENKNGYIHIILEEIL